MRINYANPVYSDQKEGSLGFALGLTTILLIAEIGSGIIKISPALISDAAHIFTDAASRAASLVAMRMQTGVYDSLLNILLGFTGVP